MILDVSDSTHLDADQDLDACVMDLYGLIHARYIITKRGMDRMVRRGRVWRAWSPIPVDVAGGGARDMERGPMRQPHGIEGWLESVACRAGAEEATGIATGMGEGGRGGGGGCVVDFLPTGHGIYVFSRKPFFHHCQV